MSDNFNILPSYLDAASVQEKHIFFQVLYCLSGVDGVRDEDEIKFISDAAHNQGIENLATLADYKNEEEVIAGAKQITNRHLALELLREMCMLSHIDNVLSDEETLFIGKVGLAMGIEIEKIEQISNWIIDRIIWLEQAKIIFEEN